VTLASSSPTVSALSWKRIRLPLRNAFSTATVHQIDRTFHLIRAELADGSVGWGETVAMNDRSYTFQSDDDVNNELTELGRHSSSASELSRLSVALSVDVPEIDGLGLYATSALRDALFDARLRSSSTSLSQALGGSRNAVSVCATIGRQPTIDSLVAEVGRLVDDQFGQVKLKVTPEWCLEPVSAVRSTYPWLVIHADANESFRHMSDEATEAVRRFAALGVASIEQPFAADDFASHAHLRRQVPDIQVVLDESVHSPGEMVGAVTVGAADAIVVKPGIVGGVQLAAQVLDAAARIGLAVRVGGMLETSVGRAGLVALASRSDVIGTGDVSPSSLWYDVDVASGLSRTTDGDIEVPLSPGWGIDVDLSVAGIETVDQHDVALS